MTPSTPIPDLGPAIALLLAHREIEQQIYRMGYALERGDFVAVGEMLRHATFGADLIGRQAFRGADEIRGQYERTNVVYPEGGRRTREIYTNILVDVDLDRGTAVSTTAYTVAQQVPDSDFHLLVAGRYEDQWARGPVTGSSPFTGPWHWTDRYIVVQFKNSLDRHMHPGSQPYN